MKNNPYIGPRPYERGDRQNFFGRDRDARDLIGLILAEREVLFYAQSGAGKTSLLNAQVIPTLEEEGFLVLPVTRVGSSLPPGLTAEQVPNIFVLSALIGLAGADVPIEVLPQHTLLSFLREYYLQPSAQGKPRPPLLILDQFEELFTTHQERWADATGFFQQVRELLDAEPRLGIVLAMREDHVAEIDPFVRYLPRRLAARYRMERLRREEALEAVTQPAQQAGCAYAPGVAERLVGDLSRIRVQRRGEAAAMAEAEVPGPVVEPVQLQVVCQRLWENLPDDGDNVIAWEEISQFGNIDRALTDFYETAIKSAMTAGVSERQLRRWFGTQLITPLDTRGLALRGTSETAGLPNAAVDLLENRHVIRADVRAGSIWYELSHDRLVEPIVQSNRAWEAARQTPLRTAAQQWQQTGSTGLLYRGRALQDALVWAQINPTDVEPYEQDFLEASQQAQRTRARQRRLLIGGTVAGIAILLVMLALTAWAVNGQNNALAAQADADSQKSIALTAEANAVSEANTRATAQAKAVSESYIRAAAEADALKQRDEARHQSQIALMRQLGAQSIAHLTDQFDLSILLSLETGQLASTLGNTFEGPNSLLRVLEYSPRLRGFLHGRAGVINNVAFSPDGTVLASANEDNTIVLWDVANRQQIGKPLIGHNDNVYSVAFSPNGKTLVSGSADKTIRLWNISDPESPIQMGVPITGHTGPVKSLAFSPDGRTLVSGSDDKTLILWNVSNLNTPVQVGQPLIGHAGIVFSVAFSPDGKMLASGSADKTIRLWNVTTLTTPVEVGVPMIGHGGDVSSISFSPNGSTLASGSADRTVILWDISRPKNVTQLRAPMMSHSAEIMSVAFSPDGKMLASGSADKTVRLWDVSNLTAPMQLGQPLVGHSSYIMSVAFSPDGGTLASGGADQSLALWNTSQAVAPLQATAPLTGHINIVSSVAFRPDGKMFASGSWDGTIRLWNISNLKSPVQAGEPITNILGRVWSVAFDRDGETLASATDAKLIDLRDVSNLHLPIPIVRTLKGHTANVLGVVFSPDGKLLASGSADNTIRLWPVSNLQDPAELGTPLTGHTGYVSSIAFSPDGKTLASGSLDGTIRLWNLSSQPTPLMIGEPINGQVNGVTSVAFSPDGKMIAAAGLSRKIRLWNVTDRAAPVQVGTPLNGHIDYVWNIVFSPDGKTLASASGDNTIILWDLTEPQTPVQLGLPLAGHTGLVMGLAFSPDGNLLASGSGDTTILMWDMNRENWRDRACNIVGRNFTIAEWQLYLGNKPYRKTCDQWPLEPAATPTPTPTPAP